MILNNNVSVALRYANEGVRVFPCLERTIGKQPSKSPYTSDGWHAASANMSKVADWWKRWPRAIVGLPCRMNGVIAIDADRHGDGDGVLGLLDLFNRYAFNPNSVPVVATPRDGRHYFFQTDPDFVPTKGRLIDAVDIRDRAYVIAGGSTMGDGRFYSLCNGTIEQFANAISKRLLPALPNWLVPLVVKPPLRFSSPCPQLAGISDAKVKGRISGLVRKVVMARKGERNAMLHWASCRVGELVALHLVRCDVAQTLMVEAGRQAGLSEHEVYATVRSGLRAAYPTI